jgi:pyruvate dehydrogenase E2 component (dihydrolipoamide acetyltransferase)
MANDVVMPRLGWTMEAGAVVEWLKRDGETVSAGEPIFTVEADKGITEVEALDDGILRIPRDSPIGVEVPVGTTLAYIAAAGDAIPEFEAVFAQAANSPEFATSAMSRSTPARTSITSENGRPRISPRARRRARELDVEWSQLVGSGVTGRIIEKDVLAASALPAAPRFRATPAVRQMADAQGVGLEAVAPTGPSGRITRADIRLAARRPTPVGNGEPMSQVRRIISQRMATAARTVAPVTLTSEADATELVAFRTRLKDELAGSVEAIPSITDLIARIAALALVEHPDLNASLDGEAIVRHEAVNVGIAVDSERGLIVPVIRDAHRKSIHAVAAESAALIDAARRGTVATNDLTGGTFTVTNLGMYEIDAFTPIVNLPECAILGVGRIVARPVVLGEEAETIAVRKMMALSLTFDHRIVDGGPAARFLQQIKRNIERPFVPLTR